MTPCAEKRDRQLLATWSCARTPLGALCDSAHRLRGTDLCTTAAAHQARSRQQNHRLNRGARCTARQCRIQRDVHRCGGAQPDRCGALWAPNQRGPQGLLRTQEPQPRPALPEPHQAQRLAASLQHRVNIMASWVVRLDTALMQNADISSVEYQQGALAGCGVREHLLDAWDLTCAY